MTIKKTDEEPSMPGFRHHHTDQALRAYMALSPSQKLRWLHEAWCFTADFLPDRKRHDMQRLRRGEV